MCCFQGSDENQLANMGMDPTSIIVLRKSASRQISIIWPDHIPSISTSRVAPVNEIAKLGFT